MNRSDLRDLVFSRVAKGSYISLHSVRELESQLKQADEETQEYARALLESYAYICWPLPNAVKMSETVAEFYAKRPLTNFWDRRAPPKKILTQIHWAHIIMRGEGDVLGDWTSKMPNLKRIWTADARQNEVLDLSSMTHRCEVWVVADAQKTMRDFPPKVILGDHPPSNIFWQWGLHPAQLFNKEGTPFEGEEVFQYCSDSKVYSSRDLSKPCQILGNGDLASNRDLGFALSYSYAKTPIVHMDFALEEWWGDKRG